MATYASPAHTRDLLVKLCGLLGSDFEGERAAAALKITAVLQHARWRWDDILRQPGVPEAPGFRSTAERPPDREERFGQEPRRTTSPLDWRADLACCQRYDAYLTEGEGDYVAALGAVIASGRACLRAADSVTL